MGLVLLDTLWCCLPTLYSQSRHKYSLVAQFRLGILPPEIETDRFKLIDVNGGNVNYVQVM